MLEGLDMGALLEGAPLGEGGAGGLAPYERVARRVRRERREATARRALVVMLALSMALMATVSAFAAQTGWWDDGKAQHVGGRDAGTTYVYTWIDASTGEPADPPITKRVDAAGGGGTVKPADPPDGWTFDEGHGTGETTSREANSDTAVIKDDEPKLVTGHEGKFLEHMMVKLLWGTTKMVSGGLSAASGAIWGAIDLTSGDLFPSDFRGGTWGAFYSVASAINTKVAIPFGTAFLGVALGLALVHITDKYRHGSGFDWYESGLLGTILMFAVAWTLITHAMQVCGAIYWLGAQLAKGVSGALEQSGLQAAYTTAHDAGASGIVDGTGTMLTSATLATTMRESFDRVLDVMTYDDWGYCFVVLIMALIAFSTIFGCVTYIVVTAFVRMAEIYARSALSPIALAFFLDEKARPIGWGWVKRFGALSFQAGIIIFTVGLSGLFLQVGAGLTSSLASGEQGAFVAVIPAVAAVSAMTAIVHKSEPIANGLFGLGA